MMSVTRLGGWCWHKAEHKKMEPRCSPPHQQVCRSSGGDGRETGGREGPACPLWSADPEELTLQS